MIAKLKHTQLQSKRDLVEIPDGSEDVAHETDLDNVRLTVLEPHDGGHGTHTMGQNRLVGPAQNSRPKPRVHDGKERQ